MAKTNQLQEKKIDFLHHCTLYLPKTQKYGVLNFLISISPCWFDARMESNHLENRRLKKSKKILRMPYKKNNRSTEINGAAALENVLAGPFLRRLEKLPGVSMPLKLELGMVWPGWHPYHVRFAPRRRVGSRRQAGAWAPAEVPGATISRCRVCKGFF